MVKSELEKRMDELEKRVIKLEKTVFTQKTSAVRSKNYKGLVGGIRFLVDSGFFKKLRSVNDAHNELKREGYYHSLQTVDTILRRDFVSKKKILSRTKEDDIWKYAVRK